LKRLRAVPEIAPKRGLPKYNSTRGHEGLASFLF